MQKSAGGSASDIPATSPSDSSSATSPSKMRTRSTSSPTPKGGSKTGPGVPLESVPGSANSLHTSLELKEATSGSGSLTGSTSSVSSTGSATTTASTTSGISGGLGFLGIRRRANSNSAASTSLSPVTATAAASPAGNGKVLLQSYSFNHGVASSNQSQRSPSIGGSSINSGISGLYTGGRFLGSPSAGSRSMTFGEFRRFDVKPRRQRQVLYVLQRHDARVKLELTNLGVKDTKKPFKEPKFKEDKSRKGFGKLGGLLQKKKKKRTRIEIFHLLSLAIVDQRTTQACVLLEELSSAALRKKQPQLANKVFLSALAQGMEGVCIGMLEKGFPVSVNSSVVVHSSMNASPQSAPASAQGANGGASPQKPIGMKSFQLPSYFMCAVALGLENLVKAMIKRADVNQTWHGLSPLHLTAAKNSSLISSMLLDNGADVNLGIRFSQYTLLRRLKSTSTSTSAGNPVPRMPKLRGLNSLKQAGLPVTEAAPKKKSIVANIANEPTILPVEIAAANGHFELARTLLSRMDTKTCQNSSFGLLVQRDIEFTTLLIRAGVPIGQKDPDGSTALHLAARAGDLDMVIALVYFKHDVNAKGQNDWTALHEAISQRRVETIKYLLKVGANMNAVNNLGETPRALGSRLGLAPSELDDMLNENSILTLSPENEQNVTAIIKAASTVPIFNIPSASQSKSDTKSIASSLSMSGSNNSPVTGRTSKTARRGDSSSSVTGSIGSSNPTASPSSSTNLSPSTPTPPPSTPSSTSSARFPSLPSFLSRGSSNAVGSSPKVEAPTNPEENGTPSDSYEPIIVKEKAGGGLLKGRFGKRSESQG
ncbi:Ankyrin repeat domain-containing protein 42 [Chytridiales sp. JEL 0842]|nr:Ankyrin repeat domain-containing protein 42 [Chytridiales sp. JEL 0842]